jgi:hypothetical protein
MNIGDLIFVRSNSLMSKTIKAFDGEFSHVAVAMSNNRILESEGMTKSRVVPF